MKTKSKAELTDVAKWKRRQRIRNIAFASVCGIVAVISALISLGAFGGDAWKDIYRFCGLTDFTNEIEGYPLCVSFVDVGDGDCILIECDGHAALIDSGGLSLDGTAARYIKKRGIETLDFIICSHMDDDHIGDMDSVPESVNVGSVYVTQLSDEKHTDSSQRLSKALSAKGIKPEALRSSDELKLGEMTLEVLSPQRVYEEDNDNSLVIRAVYGEVSFLFTGDAGEEAEKDILASGKNIKSTVLKVAHHGSKTATTEEFLEAVSPDYAIVSVGDTNKYLPNRGVVERITDFGCELLRTDVDGTVVLASNGYEIYKYKEKER